MKRHCARVVCPDRILGPVGQMKRHLSKPLRVIRTVALLTLLCTSVAYWANRHTQERKLIAAIRTRNNQKILAALANGASGETWDIDPLPSEPQECRRFDDYESIPALLLLYRIDFENRQDASFPGPDVRVVRALLDHGAQVNDQDAYGYSPLWFAIQCSNGNVVRLLLERGANVDVKDIHGATPLMWANAKMAQILLEHGARIEAASRHDGAALIWAARLNKPDVVHILLKWGANIAARDASGKTAFDYVRRDNSADARKIAALLRRYGAK